MTSPALPVSPALARRLSGSPALLFLDVDGTLAPIAPTPAEARVPDDTKRVVAALARRPGVQVALVSGRAATDARRLVGVGHVWTIGNHGMEVVTPDGESIVNPRIAPFTDAVADVLGRVRAAVAGIPGVIVEDKRLSLSVHYRLADRAAVPRVRSAVEEIGREHGMRVTGGKEVVEVRPPVDVHKGTSILELAEQLGGTAAGATMLFMGDDRTDEDAFHALRTRLADAVTVHVGAGVTSGVPTRAEFLVPDTEGARELLQWILTSRGEMAAGRH